MNQLVTRLDSINKSKKKNTNSCSISTTIMYMIENTGR